MDDESETTTVISPEHEEEIPTTAVEATVPDPDTNPDTNATFDDNMLRESINLGSVSDSKLGTTEKDEVIDLEGDIELGEAKPLAFGPPRSSKEVQEEFEKKIAVQKRVSIDATDEITRGPTDSQDREVNLDRARASIRDPDLMMSPKNIFGEPRVELGPVVEISSESSIEEEEEIESELISYLAELGVQPEKEPINREIFEEEYENLKAESLSLRRKNGLLNRKITEYYRKRKIARVFESAYEDNFDTMYEQYEEKIQDFHEFNLKTIREKEAVDNELKDLINLRDEHLADLIKSFAAMQEREKEVGHGLIDSNTGKAISDKVVERLVARQKAKSEEISKIRLAFIKRRDRVKAIENKITALDTIGGTLHLMDFEQLRMENQTFTDKIEERDEELMRLRDRYAHAIQAIAHIREKINIIEAQIDGLQGKKSEERNNVGRARERLNLLKIQRDTFRAQRDKLKTSTGILTYPKLLLDMEIGLKRLQHYRSEMQQLQTLNKFNRDKLVNIRNTIEKTEHVLLKKQLKKSMKKGVLYYKNRPTLLYPTFPKVPQTQEIRKKKKSRYELNKSIVD